MGMGMAAWLADIFISCIYPPVQLTLNNLNNAYLLSLDQSTIYDIGLAILSNQSCSRGIDCLHNLA